MSIAANVGVTLDKVALVITDAILRRVAGVIVNVAVMFEDRAKFTDAQALTKATIQAIVAGTPGLASIVTVTDVTTGSGGSSPGTTPKLISTAPSVRGTGSLCAFFATSVLSSTVLWKQLLARRR
jgi:hypothetical protein